MERASLSFLPCEHRWVPARAPRRPTTTSRRRWRKPGTTPRKRTVARALDCWRLWMARAPWGQRRSPHLIPQGSLQERSLTGPNEEQASSRIVARHLEHRLRGAGASSPSGKHQTVTLRGTPTPRTNSARATLNHTGTERGVGPDAASEANPNVSYLVRSVLLPPLQVMPGVTTSGLMRPSLTNCP